MTAKLRPSPWRSGSLLFWLLPLGVSSFGRLFWWMCYNWHSFQDHFIVICYFITFLLLRLFLAHFHEREGHCAKYDQSTGPVNMIWSDLLTSFPVDLLALLQLNQWNKDNIFACFFSPVWETNCHRPLSFQLKACISRTPPWHQL